MKSMTTIVWRVAGVLVLSGTTYALAASYKSTLTSQRGPDGVGMEQGDTKKRLSARTDDNALPLGLPPAAGTGELASKAYKNVQVLGDLTSDQFTQLMVTITTWVAPQQGCAYCHPPQKDAQGNIVLVNGVPQADERYLHLDTNYAKVVARRMFQMTQYVNAGWKTHVKEIGVTCWTCHRGNPVPKNIWWTAAPVMSRGMLGYTAGQNIAAPAAAQASLPGDPFTPYLLHEEPIRVISTQPLPIDNTATIKETEWTYSLMMHMSQALAVNCTYCHNTRSMAAWEGSPVARTSAWYGIRMVRDLNRNFLEPLGPTYPPELNRLGPTGDAPKLNCATCHNAAYKPLLGKSMLADYPILRQAPAP